MNSTFILKQVRRVAEGIVIGSLLAGFIHLFLRDSIFLVTVRLKWRSLGIGHTFDGFHAYAPEIYTALIGLLALFVVPCIRYLRRFVRAWMAGITSLTMLISAVLVAAMVLRSFPRINVVVTLTVLAGVISAEYWWWKLRPPQPANNLQLNIPKQRSDLKSIDRWSITSADDPIEKWEQDIIGRAAIVEFLAEHSLRNRTPIVALCADFGDGKTSVLNLFRQTVQGLAIVVSFSAWLPGSETTFATDLFRDIATECRKYVLVPQLRKHAAAYARTLSGSFSYLGGLREIVPPQSQREEIDDLRAAMERIPLPVVVLLDDIDRMQREELLVLLKILRGAGSIPNLTFICSFSPKEIKKELAKDLSDDYLDKFFPVTINVAPPAPDELRHLFCDKLKDAFRRQKWFPDQASEKKFSELLERVWKDSLSRLCTNLRKVNLLLNDIFTAARPITLEIDPFDLIVIETIRRFYPDVYRTVRTNPLSFTLASDSLIKGRLFTEEEKKRIAPEFFQGFEATISKSNDPAPVEAMLSWIFPDYAASKIKGASIYQIARPANSEIADAEKRICDPDYFPIYFRAAVPEEIFSNAELHQILHDLGDADTEPAVESIFRRNLDAIPKLHPKRDDFLLKLGRALEQVNDKTAERLAYASASCAADYGYDVWNVGEAARALNIVFLAAQKLSASAMAQQILENAMLRATDDTFAKRLLEFTQNRDRNRVLTDFSNIDPNKVKEAFIERMRRRYGPDMDIKHVDISKGDWWAFRLWAEHSDADATIEQGFWRRFVGMSRKRLAQMINFVYPGGAFWSSDPRPIIDKLLPMAEIQHLLDDVPAEDHLDEIEEKGIERFNDLIQGKYPNSA